MWLVGVDVSGFVRQFVINGVDVTDYVEGELDRRNPERVQLREIRSADGFRAMWHTIEQLWTATMARAARLPEDARQEQVDGEWSFVQTLRHLVWITDSWASRTVLDQEMPFSPLGLPQTAHAPADAAALGITPDARPTSAEVLAVRADRMAVVRGILDGLTDADLSRSVSRAPAPAYPAEPRAVGDCLGVVMEEEIEHHRFATRDLAALEGASGPLPG